LGAGWVVASGGVAVGLKKMDETQAMRAAVMSSSFFVASLIHIPLFGVSIHLTLTGLLGIVLGWVAFPAVLVALLLQAVLFGFGGITTLGLNTCIMAAPAVAVYYVLRVLRVKPDAPSMPVVCGVLGAMAIVLASMLMAGILSLAGEAFRVAAVTLLISQLPVVGLEGVVTGAASGFLRKVSPELLSGAAWRGVAPAHDGET